jgi:hypothetical protein
VRFVLKGKLLGSHTENTTKMKKFSTLFVIAAEKPAQTDETNFAAASSLLKIQKLMRRRM